MATAHVIALPPSNGNKSSNKENSITAVQNIIDGIKNKDNIWAVNSEKEYHEEKSTDTQTPSTGPGRADL